MTSNTGEGQVQVHLKTKQPQYAVPDVPYSIEAVLNAAELNTFVNTLLESCSEVHKKVDFDFLVFDEYLQGRLCDHLKDKGISFEDAILVEYVERFPAPEPQDCLLHDDWVSAVKTCGNYVVSGSYDDAVNIWTIKGKHVLTINGHKMPVKAVDWVYLNEEGGRLVSCSQDQVAMVWDWSREGNTVECVCVCKGHERGIDSVDVNEKKDFFATGSWDCMLKIWSLDNKEEAKPGYTKAPKMTLQGHRECISAVKWMDASTILSGSWDHTMKIWDLQLEGIKTEISTNKTIFDVSHSKLNGLIVTASADKNLRLYDPRTNQGSVVRFTYMGHQQWVQSVMWSTTEEYLFISGSHDNQVKLWDFRSPKAPLYDLIGHSDKVFCVDWTNPKYIVSGGADNTVRVYKSRKAIASSSVANHDT